MRSPRCRTNSRWHKTRIGLLSARSSPVICPPLAFPPVSHVEPEIIASALARLVDRLRTASEPRLTRPNDQLAGQSLAEATYGLAVWCVERAEEITASELPELPRIGPFAAGDQVWVVGQDLLVLLAGVDASAAVGQEFLDRVNAIRSVS